MKKAAFVVILIPVLFFAASFTGPLEQLAQADSGVRGGRAGHSVGRDGFVGRGGGSVRGRGGGDVVLRQGGRDGFVGRGSRDAVFRHSSRGGFVGRGDFVGHRSHGHGHRHGGHFSTSIWLGPGWGPGWGVWDPFYYPFYPSYRYPYPYYAPPTVVVPQEPQEYISLPDSQEQEETGYWYYCKDANGYYPYVKRCPGGWMKVVPYHPPPGQDQED
ncbi:MAG: hypothetical protein A2075_19635 [Geobacteraceae bacterium GWC2_58_44]|nr:MAG: hypothetical protein A2075_19635 [Geobacteraceae bacterium GWC2_58_44]HBG06950.1 hypothetical protein [Geobacter sp.]